MEAKETVKVIFWDVWEMAGVHDHQPSQPLGQWGCSPSCSPCSYVTIPPQPDSCLYSCCWNVWQLSYLPTVVSSSQSSSSPFHQSSTSSPLVLWSRSWFRMLRDSFLHYVPPLYPTIPILHQIQISSPIQASSSSAFIRWWDDPHWPIDQGGHLPPNLMPDQTRTKIPTSFTKLSSFQPTPLIVLSSSPSLTSSTSGQQSLDDAAWTRPFTSSAVSCVVRVWEVKWQFHHLHICMFRQTVITDDTML